MRAPAAVGMRLEEVDTPALVIELDAFERNFCRMIAALDGRGVRLRAHAKTHKCPQIARLQMAAGAAGVCCQKVSEAEAMVEGGIGDVLVTNEIVGAQKLARLAELARRAHIGVCVDHARNVHELDAACAAAGASLDVYVEVDVGAHRCGVAAGEPAAALAREVARSAHLRLAGLQAYHGAAQHVRSTTERRAQIGGAAAAAQASRGAIEAAGIACPVVTGGGTGSFMFEIESGAYNEIQAGSYVFMDADYARNQWDDPLPRFEHGLFVLATVMSCPAPERAVVDAGLKALSVDSGLPLVWERPGLVYARASDEHGVIDVARGAVAPEPGDRLSLVPGHCDPTVNLYDWYVCVRAGRVEALWPITARGAIY